MNGGGVDERLCNVIHPVTYLRYKNNLELMYMLSDNNIKKNLSKWCDINGIKSVAAYGTGKIGQLFVRLCSEIGLENKFNIDNFKNQVIGDIPTYHYDEIRDGEVDLIVACSGICADEMVYRCRLLMKTRIITLRRLLELLD